MALLSLGSASAAAQSTSPMLGAEASQRLTLDAGPNLVSLPVAPSDRSLETLFGDHIDRVFLVSNHDEEVFVPLYQIRTLTEWSWDDALFVNAQEPFTLDVVGPRIAPESSISLPEGWSWIPMLLEDPTPVEDALWSVASVLLHVEDADGRVYPATSGAPLLTTLVPGQGYRVRLSSPSTLTFASPPDDDDPIVVETVLDAIALPEADLTPGRKVYVEGFRAPGDGGADTLRVTTSGCVPDGGTCFVPTASTQAGEPYTSSSSFTLYGENIQW